MKQNTTHLKINLNLTRESISNLFFKWIINVGRIVIVVTELIALSALFYRFTIDRQIIDLHDQIKSQISIVKAQEQKELEYRRIQKTLASIKVLTDDANMKLQATNDLLTLIKTRGILTNTFRLSNDSLLIDGKTSSMPSLVEFINDLKKKEYVTAINIDHINSEDQGVTFSMSVKIKTSSPL